MGNSLRCCIGCVLPCGALDLIRIVHISGRVEEIHRPITAGEVLKDNPNHVLSNPCSSGVNSRKVLILSPEMELKRGGIYFLIPNQSQPEKIKKTQNVKRREKTEDGKKSRRDRRRARVGVWRPHLDSICEDQQ